MITPRDRVTLQLLAETGNQARCLRTPRLSRLTYEDEFLIDATNRAVAAAAEMKSTAPNIYLDIEILLVIKCVC